MNLLLLLSAILSALTGAVPGARRAEVPQAVAQQIAARVAVRVTVADRAIRPAFTLPPLRVLAVAPRPAVLAFGTGPIWIDRRRE